MAVINRYSNQAIAQYNPMSMNELSFAPSYLREKHDLTEAKLGELDEKSKLFGDILDQYGDPATQLAKPLQDDIVNLASSLSKQGVKRSNAIPEAMKLKSKYASLYGPQGDIGKLQSATAEYRNEVKKIQEQFKDSPELARGALARLNARQAQVNDGRLELGDMSSPQLYRHIKDEDIMKQLDSAANSLKPSDLAALKITSKANIGNFTDLLTLTSQNGVTPDRLLRVMQSNISPEIRNSILQYAELVQNIPRNATIDLPTDDKGGTMKVEAGMVDFYDRMQRNAAAKAYTNTDYKTVTTKDDLGLERAKQKLGNLIVNPGPRIERSIENVLDNSNLKFDEKGESIVEKPSTGQGFKDWWNNTQEAGRYNGYTWSPITLVMDVLEGISDTGSLIGKNPELVLYANNPTALSAKLAQIGATEYFQKKYQEKEQEKIKKDMTTSVSAYREAYPEFSKMSNKQVYEQVLKSREQFANTYSDVIIPDNADFSFVNKTILGEENHAGDFENRAIFTGNQNLGLGSEFYKKLGYSNFKEFKEKGMPQITPGVTFGAKSPAAFVGNAIDSEGQHVSFTIQSSKNIENAGKTPHKLLQLVQEGELFKEYNKNNKEANSFGLPLKEGESFYYMFDVELGEPLLIRTDSGLKPQEIQEFVEKNPDDVITFPHAVQSSINAIFNNQYGVDPSSQLKK